MVEGAKARALVSKILPSWYCCSMDSLGQSGGLCVTWNPTKAVLQPSLTCAGILLEGTLLEGNIDFLFQLLWSLVLIGKPSGKLW
jgi:hypothetical protein